MQAGDEVARRSGHGIMNRGSQYSLGYITSLIFALAKRDLTAQYRDATFGVLWAVLKPTLFMLVFSVLKGVMRLPSDGLPYPLFSFTGVAIWLLFVSVMQGATPSILRNAGIIRKMPTPRIVFPVSGLTVSLSEFVFAMLPLAGLIIYFGHALTWHALYLFPIAIITALTAFSLALGIATFSVFRNDLTLALPFVLQAGLFLSPILYPLSAVPEQYQGIYKLNPMVGPLEGARAAVLMGQAPDWNLFLPSLTLILILLPFSVFVYHRVSRYFADVF